MPERSHSCCTCKADGTLPANQPAFSSPSPLGHLYGLDVYVDLPLSHQQKIVFNAGTPDEAIALAYPELERLSRTQVVEIGKPYDKPAIQGALQI